LPNYGKIEVLGEKKSNLSNGNIGVIRHNSSKFVATAE
jgi:hypothetical protein